MEPRTVDSWDVYHIKAAFHAASKSKDPSTQVGCVIVGQDNEPLSTGFNGFPRGINELVEARWERPEKYSWVEHAERNAVYNAARSGIRLKGARAYLNWAPHPCADCMRAFIQAGIVEIIGPDIPFQGKGSGVNYSLEYAGVMALESGILIRVVPWSDHAK